MTHEDAGHYAAKHPRDIEPDPVIADALKPEVKNQRISCAAAHRTAADLNVEPLDIGITIDLMEIRIEKCQLGLFGYTPRRKIVTPAAEVDPELAREIEAAVENDRIACKACWEIADRHGMTRLALSAACEKLQIKMSPCQLGAF